MLEVADLPALTEAAHAAGALVVVDNTFATPLVQRPLELGADVVVHSVTKYLAGHSDVVMGAAVTADPELQSKLHAHRTLHGAIAGPMEAFLALRGMRTLALRLERSQTNAAELAHRAEAARRDGSLPIAAVRYPGLADHPQHALAARQMHGGFGSVLTVEVAGTDGGDGTARRRTPPLPLPTRPCGPCGCGCRPPPWAGSSRSSSGGGASPRSRRPSRPGCCGSVAGSSTWTTCGTTSCRHCAPPRPGTPPTARLSP